MMIPFPLTTRLAAVILLAGSLGVADARAQTPTFGEPYKEGAPLPKAQEANPHGGEHYHARGHRNPPPGYQDAPSTEFKYGPDPDHEAGIQRDKTTGANLGRFGSSYQDSNPAQSGELGDATGNGWVAPRGNGF